MRTGKIHLAIRAIAALAFGPLAAFAPAAEYQVAISGNDCNSGTSAAPFRTIQHAADLAQPGDTITVHAGVYRERVSPTRGGTSDENRIVYQAAPGEKAEITGSEPITTWQNDQDNLWKVILPNSYFGDFNPYSDAIHGDWFRPFKGRINHTGSVYLNGDWLTEAVNLQEIKKPLGETPLWYSKVDDKNTTIWAQFKDINPNRQSVEINVRRTVFYPKQEGINFITVRGFTLRDAADNWAPPTAEQVGLIGAHWSKGWIIENNVVCHAACCGISLGKYGDQYDNTSGAKAPGQVATTERAETHGWNKETVGHHIVRNNTIFDCDQAGIVGNLGGAFSIISGNLIYNIHARNIFDGAEIAGIKFHGAVDTQIIGNHVHHCFRGLWLDWMAQGTRVSGNLFHDNTDRGYDIFAEVDHGPFVVDNNIFLSPKSIDINCQGGAFVQNVIAGEVNLLKVYEPRSIPFLQPHSTTIAGMRDNPSGDMRFYNNILIHPTGLAEFDKAQMPCFMEGNVYLNHASPGKFEASPFRPDMNPNLKLVEKSDGFYLDFTFDKSWATARPRRLVTGQLLGKAAIPNLPYENPDGSPVLVNIDYFGSPRNTANPFPGPFELPDYADQSIKVWPSSDR